VSIVAIGALALAGCGSSDSSDAANTSADAGPCGTTDDTTLTVGLFGTFGFKEAGLWDAYKKVCPNITIKEDVVEQSADYWTRLKTRLASLSVMYETTQAVSHILDLDQLLDRILELIFNSIPADHGCVMLRHPDSGADQLSRYSLGDRGKGRSVAPALTRSRCSSSAPTRLCSAVAPRLPSTNWAPRNDRMREALCARRSRHAGCRSRSISIASNSIDLLLVPEGLGAGTDRNGIDTGLWAIRGPGSGDPLDPEIRPGWPSAEMMSVGS